jgi:glucose-6-phosphate isomerase
MKRLVDSMAWRALRAHRARLAKRKLRDLFAEDPTRFRRFSLVFDGILLDYSKNRIDAKSVALLSRLARERRVAEWTKRLFSGEAINVTEDRAAYHVALRHRGEAPMKVGGRDVMPAVRGGLAQMRRFTDAVRSGAWRGATGQKVTDVVGIGIGGSHLGPRLATQALSPYADGPNVHYLSNVDGGPIHALLARLDPARTLFIVSSKTFGTQETMLNAGTARRWFVERLGSEAALARHVVAVTANARTATAFGVAPDNVFAFWDWVGGRMSLWSAIGLSVALSVGMDRFEEMLEGASAMDRHFRRQPVERNMPALLALLGIWEIDFWNSSSFAILPYDDRLRGFPDYIRQLDMESNGKRVTREGRAVAYHTAPVVFGEAGTNGQHAFFQALHQGTRVIPADFIVVARPHHPRSEHHSALVANCLAQTEALMLGRSRSEARALLEAEGRKPADVKRLAPHLTFEGSRPTTTLVLDTLSPRRLGQLIALYEHKIFVQSVIWGLNAFDQWGVEFGKRLAGRILDEIRSGRPAAHDSSTEGLIAALRESAKRGVD